MNIQQSIKARTSMWSKISVIQIIWSSLFFSPMLASHCDPGKEDVFFLLNYYNNRVFADGIELNSFMISSVIFGFCIPHRTKLIAVNNGLVLFQDVSFVGSIGERLVTNEDWKCVNNIQDAAEWYRPGFNDTTWPKARAKKFEAFALPDYFSKNARDISSVTPSNSYYCRATVQPITKKPLTRSAFARLAAANRRLEGNVIKLYKVHDILQCLSYCLEFQDCSSMNFQKSTTQARRICELNNGTSDDYPNQLETRDEFDVYKIIEKKESDFYLYP